MVGIGAAQPLSPAGDKPHELFRPVLSGLRRTIKPPPATCVFHEFLVLAYATQASDHTWLIRAGVSSSERDDQVIKYRRLTCAP